MLRQPEYAAASFAEITMTIGRWIKIVSTHCWYAPALVAILCTAGCQQSFNIGPVADAGAAAKIAEVFGSGASGSGEEAEAAVTGTGWATLKGKFTFVGEPPAMPPYAVNKDEASCAPGGKAPAQEWLVLGDDNQLANVAVYARKVSRVHESAQPPSEPLVFDQKSCVFLTHVAAVVVGQELDIKNSDDVGHNTNVSGSNSFNQTIPVGQSVPFKPQKEDANPVAVKCSIHPWMLSYLLARKNGYVAITGKDGAFELANLPAGEEIEIQVWHEASPGIVPDGDVAKELKWSKKGRFKIKLEEDETRELDLKIPASLFAS